MIVIMQASATEEQVAHVKSLIVEMGLTPHPIVGTELTVVAVVGEDRKKDQGTLEQCAGVDRVMRVLQPYKMAAKQADQPRTVITIGEGSVGDGACEIGGKQVVIMAGPCSVESESQIMDAARKVKAAGAHMLRGGAFKPRTNPYSFQGLGEEGLKLLAAAREETGLAVVTEVLTPSDVEMVSAYADCLQIGTRNAQNFKLLEACGRQPKPVLFKRGMSMTLDEFLQAAEYMLANGNPNVILCERGIRTFEKYVRNTLPLAAVTELQHRSHLPVVVDPSQATGHARLVPAMCKAAVAAGADGLIVEVHPDPEHAMTDGAQSLAPEGPGGLEEMIGELGRVAAAVDRRV